MATTTTTTTTTMFDIDYQHSDHDFPERTTMTVAVEDVVVSLEIEYGRYLQQQGMLASYFRVFEEEERRNYVPVVYVWYKPI
jgi:hypothetical protein